MMLQHLTFYTRTITPHLLPVLYVYGGDWNEKYIVHDSNSKIKRHVNNIKHTRECCIKKFMNAFGFAENIGKVNFEHKNLLHIQCIMHFKY